VEENGIEDLLGSSSTDEEPEADNVQPLRRRRAAAAG
jgi:hypothetical protein